MLPSKNAEVYSSLLEISRPMKRRKIILLGGASSGKTALAMRFKENIFLDVYEPTIQNSIKKFLPFHNEYIELEILDLDGQTEYTIFSPNKFSFGINGYLLIYSVEDKNSFELIKSINKNLDKLVGEKIPKVLVATKTDSDKRQVSFGQGQEFADSIGCPFIEASSKTGYNAENSFLLLMTEINKAENGFDLKNMKCAKLLETFTKRYSKNQKILCLLLILNIIMGIFSIFTGCWCIIYQAFNDYFQYFPLLHGLWTTIITLIGFFSLNKEKYEIFYLQFLGFIINLVLILIGFSFYFIYLKECLTETPENKTFNQFIRAFYCYFPPASFILISFLSFCSFLFMKVLKLELRSYIM